MKKILIAVMISAMIAMCSCGVNKDSAGKGVSSSLILSRRGTLNRKGTVSSDVQRLPWCRSTGVIHITHPSRQRILTKYSGPTQIMSLIPRSAWQTISAILWLMAWMGLKETDIPTLYDFTPKQTKHV